MLLANSKDIKQKLDDFCTHVKKAVLVEKLENVEIKTNGPKNYTTVIIHFFGDSKSILAKSIILTLSMVYDANILQSTNSGFYVLNAENMTDDDITKILECSQRAQMDWFNKQKELSPSLLLNDIVFEKTAIINN